MGFWDRYWKSLKPLEVEEPIDVYLHRPLGYVLARLALDTTISPNLITLGSIVLGLTAFALMLIPFENHLRWAGGAILSAAVFDCADGMLARMRGKSSFTGRMLDGCADLVVTSVLAIGGTYLVWQDYSEPAWLGLAVVAVCLVAIVTGSFHTTMYDHHKNLYLAFTHPTYREGEDLASAVTRYRSSRGSDAAWIRQAWKIYFFYLKSQFAYARRFDPSTWVELSELPPYRVEIAERYRQRMAPLMRVWRWFFGLGSFIFGMSVAVAFSVIDYYVVFRVVLLNAVFYGYMRPEQRKASRAIRAELERMLPADPSPRQ